MFQQHHGESLSEAWTRFKDLLQKVPHHDIDLWLQVQIFYDHVNPITRRTIDQSAGGKLCDLNAEESWALLEDLTLYDNESWNDPRDFAKPVKAITLPQDVPSTSDRHLIELENQVQCLMEAHLAPTQPSQVNKVTTSYEAGVLKAITDRIAGVLPSDTVKNPKLSASPVLSARSYLKINPQCSSHPSTSINAIKEANISQTNLPQHGMGIEPQQLDEPEPTLEDEFHDLRLNLPGEILAKMKDPRLFTLPCRLGDSKPFDTLADLGSCVNIIPLYLFKKLNIGLLEKTDHIFGLADGTKSYPVRIVKDVEVHIGKMKLLNDFYVIDTKKDPETPLLVGRGFLATANAVIDCKMGKIEVGEGITRSVFRVKGVDLGEEEAPY
ncbi:MAK10-like protein [Tanacetum coccineum]|uniref:MAK10-like protein n=1 Tax=Tanacetum coccineum TaxID=301880 RepID=A0ABQ4XSX5_9ASTR